MKLRLVIAELEFEASGSNDKLVDTLQNFVAMVEDAWARGPATDGKSSDDDGAA